MKFKDKIFIIERRGGYPWSEGFFGRNDTAPLPTLLSNHGRSALFQLRVSENFRDQVNRVEKIILRIILFQDSAVPRSESSSRGKGSSSRGCQS